MVRTGLPCQAVACLPSFPSYAEISAVAAFNVGFAGSMVSPRPLEQYTGDDRPATLSVTRFQ